MESIKNIWADENLIKVLKGGSVVVMPTDTLYGLVGQALSQETVARILKIKKRSPHKFCINLIGSLNELTKFSITLSTEQKKVLENFTEPTTFVLDSISFRLPQSNELRNLLLQTGPLIAPSANPEGLTPAKNIEEAKNYFGDSVDLYIDGGEVKGKASRVIKLSKDSSVAIIRE